LVEAGACQPILGLTVSLTIILLLVLFLPFISRKVEENLEPFFLVMGIVGVAVNYYYGQINQEEIVYLAKRAVTTLSGLPIGITQVVFIFGLIFLYFHKPIYRGIDSLLRRMGFYAFVFVFITVLGFISSIISVIVTAVILSEIAAALKIERRQKIEFVVLASFAVGLGAALTPIGEPLSTIAVSKLNAPFDYLFRLLGAYIIPGILFIAAYAAYRLKKEGAKVEGVEAVYTETIHNVIERTVRVFIFVAALELLGHSFSYMAYCYFNKLPPWALYWVNTISAVVDNATLTAAEINPNMTPEQIRSALMSLLVSGGMLIPGNIPNIVAAGRLKIKSGEWARVGVPFGLALLLAYFIIIEVLGIHITL